MIEAPPYPLERKRLSSLQATGLLDTPLEERFERITRMVCRVLDVPIAVFNLLDRDRQHYKSAQGLSGTDAARSASFCDHTIHEKNMLLIPDTQVDRRFFDNPFVTGEYMNIGFYAGCPVRTPDGMPIGTLCAIDTKPRDMSPEQLTILRDLASMVETELKLVSLTGAQISLIDELRANGHAMLVDPLTRLWNRTGILKLLERESDDAVRRGGPLTVMAIGVDRIGDVLLQGVAKKILSSLRAEDSIGRTGDAMFAVILADCAHDKALESAERLRRLIAAEPVIADDPSSNVAIRTGIATLYPDDLRDIGAMLARAEAATQTSG